MGVAVLIILAILSYVIGYAVLSSMHVILFGSLRSILIKPFTVGATILLIAGFVLMFVFKGIVLLFSWLINIIIFCAPIVAIAGLIYVIVRIASKKY